ncbi:hypothetical protein GE061_015769 [Apolygus lucorum]|uniref:GB1/RHD3-type G domain-containing protein n=1 Tax=Apolygus lucorum TaxID=248454 RepID=A0A8S9XN35_APOLU|nr:hypothetical protein GE061_015769 [Apolygus lucorum]
MLETQWVEKSKGVIKVSGCLKSLVQTLWDNGGWVCLYQGDNRDQYDQPIDSKSNQWFGATLTSSNGSVLACAPRYVYTQKISSEERRDPVGTCWLAKDQLNSSQEFSPCRNRDWGYHRHGHCQAGLGAALSKINHVIRSDSYTLDMAKEAIRLVSVEYEEDGRLMFSVNESHVEKSFITEELQNMNIAVISIAGNIQEGKSLMMDLLLRYAMKRYAKNDEKVDENWMDDEGEPLEGFTPRKSSNRETKGVMVWPELFVIKQSSGEKLALLLMDTQGIMDGRSSFSEWAGIFSLSTMISSLQLFNVMSCITEQSLENLEYFSAYGQLIAPTSSEVSPYQDILFLVRDFKYGENYGFGLRGGERYLTDQFDCFTTFQLLSWNEIRYIEQHIEVRKNIEKYFNNKFCCCLPDPGRIVSETTKFNGVLKPANTLFKKQIKSFVPSIMSPDQLVGKKLDGGSTTVAGLFNRLRLWVDNVNMLMYPEPKTMYLATAESDHHNATQAAMKFYNKIMAASCQTMEYIPKRRLREIHERAKDKSIAYFNMKPKMGDGGMTTSIARERLERCISRRFLEYESYNQSKKLWELIKVPLICMIAFLLTVFFQLLVSYRLLQVPIELYNLVWWLSWLTASMFFFWFKDMFWPIAIGWWNHSPFRFVYYTIANFIRSVKIIASVIATVVRIIDTMYKMTSGRP